MNDPTQNIGTVLVDADILLHRCAAASQFDARWEGGWWCLYADEQYAQQLLDHEIADIFGRWPKAEARFFVSHPQSFRYQIDPTYKSNRQHRKPLVLASLIQYLDRVYGYESFIGLEADDGIGISVGDHDWLDYVVLSDDKDLNQVPGYHADWRDTPPYSLSVRDTDVFFLQQVLSGDPTDGIPGCPKVGPRTAERLVAPYAEGEISFREMWDDIVKVYINAGLSDDDAFRTAHLVRILRPGEYDRELEEPVLWSPYNE